MKPVKIKTKRLVNKIGPRKLKSFPFLAAQKVYPVSAETTAEVNIKASSTILPVYIMAKEERLDNKTLSS